ncbi:MAG: hypothetical protein R3F53_10200 [Gammaproteobacteria bacterium]
MSTDSKRDFDEPDLAGLEELLAVYRHSPQQQPPIELNQRILAAAAQAQTVTTLPVRQSRARWSVPLALAATMVLGVGLVTLVQHELPQHDSLGTRPALTPLRERAADSASDAVPGMLLQESAPLAAPPTEPALSDQSAAPAAKASSAASKVTSESAAPVPNENRHLQQFAPSPTPATESLRQEQQISPSSTPNLSTGRAARQAPPPAAAPAASLRAPEPAPADVLPPERWRERILRLQAQGQLAQARQELQQLRATYPDYQARFPGLEP